MLSLVKTIAITLTTLGSLHLGAAAAFADGDAEKGKRIFNRCGVCHSVGDGERHKQGPNLHGVIGREAGKADGFNRYSDAIKNSDIVWTPERLDEYLKDPRKFLPGTNMVFAGLRNDQQRADLIAYLIEATSE